MMTNSFLPARLNFPLYPSTTFRYSFQWLDEEEVEGCRKRTPHDLTGYGAKAILTTNFNTTFELVSEPFEEGKGRIFFRSGSESEEEPTAGFIQLYIDGAQTGEFEWKKASYVLLLKEGSVPKDAAEPDVFPVLAGIFTISR